MKNKRRNHSAQFKAKVALEAAKGKKKYRSSTRAASGYGHRQGKKKTK